MSKSIIEIMKYKQQFTCTYTCVSLFVHFINITVCMITTICICLYKQAHMMADNRSIDMNDDDTPLMPNNDNKGINRNGRSRSVQQRPVCYCLAAVLRPCLAEAIGVAIFVFIGSLSALSNNIVAIALAHGLTIMTLVAGFGKLRFAYYSPTQVF